VVAVAAAGAGGVTAVIADVASTPRTHVRQVLHRGSSEPSGQDASPRGPALSRAPTSHGGSNGIVGFGRSVSIGGHDATAGALHPGRGASVHPVGPFASPGAGGRGSGKGAQPGKGAQSHGAPGRVVPSQNGGGAHSSGKGAGALKGGQPRVQPGRHGLVVPIRANGFGARYVNSKVR
jgi:hypothetical protein